jgi:hypothetical protein
MEIQPDYICKATSFGPSTKRPCGGIENPAVNLKGNLSELNFLKNFVLPYQKGTEPGNLDTSCVCLFSNSEEKLFC